MGCADLGSWKRGSNNSMRRLYEIFVVVDDQVVINSEVDLYAQYASEVSEGADQRVPATPRAKSLSEAFGYVPAAYE